MGQCSIGPRYLQVNTWLARAVTACAPAAYDGTAKLRGGSPRLQRSNIVA
jgi:hypothetical protein